MLGGGGVAGIAWMTGLLTGLADAGDDVTGADLIIGTSAGATRGRAAWQRAARWRTCSPGNPIRPCSQPS